MAENVRAALVLVARGEAPLGIVYETDAKVEPNVKIVGQFPEDSHPPIIYPVAMTVNAKPDAREVSRLPALGRREGDLRTLRLHLSGEGRTVIARTHASHTCPGRSAARSGALQTRDPGFFACQPGSRICGAPLRCAAPHPGHETACV